MGVPEADHAHILMHISTKVYILGVGIPPYVPTTSISTLMGSASPAAMAPNILGLLVAAYGG